jgi:Alpha-L-arabinofuranosidase C-terminal domain
MLENITDAVVVGTFLNSLLRHGDGVIVACQA